MKVGRNGTCNPCLEHSSWCTVRQAALLDSTYILSASMSLLLMCACVCRQQCFIRQLLPAAGAGINPKTLRHADEGSLHDFCNSCVQQHQLRPANKGGFSSNVPHLNCPVLFVVLLWCFIYYTEPSQHWFSAHLFQPVDHPLHPSEGWARQMRPMAWC